MNGDSQKTNPLYSAKFLGSYSGRGTLNDLTDNLSVNLFLNKGFTLKGQFSVTKSDSKTKTFEDLRTLNSDRLPARREDRYP